MVQKQRYTDADADDTHRGIQTHDGDAGVDGTDIDMDIWLQMIHVETEMQIHDGDGDAIETDMNIRMEMWMTQMERGMDVWIEMQAQMTM